MIAISKKIKHELREFLVAYGTLTRIGDLFSLYGFEYVPLPDELLPSGQRRKLIECFYAGIDCHDSGNAQSLLALCEDALVEMGGDDPRVTGAGLIRAFEREGYIWNNEKFTLANSKLSAKLNIPKTGLDIAHLNVYIQRIESGLDNDPALAIGSAKELLESTLKTILDGSNVPYDSRSEDIHSLLKKVQKVLSLAPDDIDNAKRGSDLIKRVLSNLGTIVVGVAELRNLYGTGHGSGSKSKGLEIRHAKLVVSSSAALCEFLLRTYQERNGKISPDNL